MSGTDDDQGLQDLLKEPGSAVWEMAIRLLFTAKQVSFICQGLKFVHDNHFLLASERDANPDAYGQLDDLIERFGRVHPDRGWLEWFRSR